MSGERSNVPTPSNLFLAANPARKARPNRARTVQAPTSAERWRCRCSTHCRSTAKISAAVDASSRAFFHSADHWREPPTTLQALEPVGEDSTRSLAAAEPAAAARGPARDISEVNPSPEVLLRRLTEISSSPIHNVSSSTCDSLIQVCRYSPNLLRS